MNRMNRFLVSFMLLVIAIYSVPSFAETDSDPKSSETVWRLLGPAFSYHQDLSGSYITKPAAGYWDCRTDRSGRLCLGKNTPTEFGWSGSNPALGLEVSGPSYVGSTTRDRAFATIVRDSYGKMGVMAGAGRAWQVGEAGSFRLSAGLSGGLWYRTVANGLVSAGKISYCFQNDQFYGNDCVQGKKDFYVTKLERRIVPFVIPFLEFTEVTSGLGVNIGFIPKIKIGKYYTSPTNTLIMQLTYKIGF